MPKLDDWFVVGMSILLPLCLVLGLAAFLPTPSQWRNRKQNEGE